MRRKWKVFFIFLFFFSCSSKNYNEQELIKAFENHSYYNYTGEFISSYLNKNGIDGLKKLDKKFEIVEIKGKSVRKKTSDIKRIFYYPFILKKAGEDYLILKVFPSIAFESGLRTGILKKINSREINNLNPCEVENEIQKLSELSISFNDGKADWSMKLKKELSFFPFVWSLMADNEIGYLNIVSLSENSSNIFKANVINLQKRGATKLIIDLRALNAGNYEEAAKIIGYFSKNKKTYYIRSSKKGYTKDFYIEENPFKDFKLVLLIDRKTALLGEIIAASLKEEGSVIIGEKTNGEVYITKLFKIGNQSACVLTVAKLYPPSGIDLDEGIKPDYEASYPDYKKFGLTNVIDCDPVFSKAVEVAKNL